MTNALSEESRAWVTLGQRLGQLAGSIGGQATGQIKVTACGRLSCYSLYSHYYMYNSNKSTLSRLIKIELGTELQNMKYMKKKKRIKMV